MRPAMLFSIMTILLMGITLGQSRSIQVGSQERTFIAYAPQGLPDNSPLVLSMHGLTGTGSQQRSMSRFDAIADREQFVVVYPDGLNNRWDLSGTTDVNFLLALIDTMAARYKIDRNRVYCCGFSMGGMISYRMACMASDKIAAIGPCAGYAGGSCSQSRAVPILHIHGTMDTIMSYTGLANHINGFLNRNGCPNTPAVTEPYPESKPNSKVKKEYYGPCNNGSEIIVLHVGGMSHAWPGSFGSQDINASEEFWEFFKKHSLGPVKITKARSPATVKKTVSARYAGGKIHLRNGQGMRSVRVLNIQGKELFAWNASSNPENAFALPVNRIARGMYLLDMTGIEDHKAVRVIIP